MCKDSSSARVFQEEQNMGHHDEFDLDVRLGSGSSLAGSPRLQDDGDDTLETCADICTGQTCATCDTQCGQNTCATCDTQCGQNTCATCATCDTQCGQNTCDTQCCTCDPNICPTQFGQFTRDNTCHGPSCDQICEPG